MEFAFILDCDQWYTLDPPSLDPVPSRFGHSANVYNNEIYIFGGFNGFVLSDLLVYKPGEGVLFKCLPQIKTQLKLGICRNAFLHSLFFL